MKNRYEEQNLSIKNVVWSVFCHEKTPNHVVIAILASDLCIADAPGLVIRV